jgi:ATP-binding protein involved in chromosome partitioning
MLKNKLIEVCDQTSWGKLDFLLIDLPSGNMDLALFIGKNLPACQFLMVTTPAVPAIAELRQDIRLLQMHHITPLGLIENMSFFIGSNSADHLELIGIFSAGGGQRVCQETSIPLLATIPISLDIAAASEAEKPVYEHCPESEVLPYYLSLTKQLLRCCLTG